MGDGGDGDFDGDEDEDGRLGRVECGGRLYIAYSELYSVREKPVSAYQQCR